jgi:cyclic-di-AMP phosphodiesterase PgpH
VPRVKLMVAFSGRRAVATWVTAQRRAWSQRSALALFVGTGLSACVLGVLIASPRTLRPVYRYAIGDFASSAIRAPWDLSIRDDDATARLRDETALHTPPVASYDAGLVTLRASRVEEAFKRARDLVVGADATRVVSDAERARLDAAGLARLKQARARAADRAVRAATQDASAQVETQLGVRLTPDERNLLSAGGFDRRFDDGLSSLLEEAYARPVVRDAQSLRDAALRSQRPGEPARVILRVGASAPDRVPTDAALLDDVRGAVERIRTRAAYLLPTSSEVERELLVGLASRLVTPDTDFDEAATVERRAKAAADVLPISLNFRRNQLIVGEGQEVTREALLVLDYLRQQGMPHAFLGRATGAAALTWVLLAALLWLPYRMGLPWVAVRDAAFGLAMIVGATAAFWIWLLLVDSVSARVPGLPRIAALLLFPATAAPMLAGLMVPRRLVVGLVGGVAVLAGLLTDLGILMTAHTCAVGLLAAQLVYRCRQRACVIKAGVPGGVAGVVSAVGVFAVAGSDGGLGGAAAAAVGAFVGAASGGLVALAFSGPAEWAFGYSTRLSLVELLSYDHPLLRRFMERAPGTFQHSVSVALLARMAADAIGADALLVRVGALYHDVGKMEHPEFFTENQRGENPHDGMAPEDSARAILDHVALGVGLLGQYGVRGRIADFAKEHHGTGSVTVFRLKAEAMGHPVDPALYQYLGPRPRSRETAVLMMADKIEATARSRGATTADEFRSIVNGTLDGLLEAGQLDESALTLHDLAVLRHALVTALVNLHHTRVDYPAPAAPGASDAQSPAEP